jgi:hypothetical protein
MQAAGIILAIAGVGAGLVGWFWLVVLLFRESRMMGYAAMFCVPILALLPVFTSWEEAKKPFFILLGGSAMAGLGALLANYSATQ